jgi:hypothetical protein
MGVAPAEARMLLSQKNALAMAFQGGSHERRTAFLTHEQALRAEKAAQSKLESQVWTYYTDGSTTAYY